MFFAEKEEEKFSKKIRGEICRLESKDKEIYWLNKDGKNVDLRIIDFVMDSLNLFLKNEKLLDNEQKKLMTEAIGKIPVTFFALDNLKAGKRVKEAINPLIDIIDAHANLHINRKKLISAVLEDLKKIKANGKAKNK